MIVSIDTSTLTMSLALLDGARVGWHLTLGPPTRLSRVLPGAITEVLARHAVSLAALDGFVVGIGPGSFTGLRISLSCVKGLAYALKRPVAGVSSLAAVAAEGPEGAELFASAVVKKGELYLRRHDNESVLTVAQFADAMRERPLAIALGPGVVEYRDALIAQG